MLWFLSSIQRVKIGLRLQKQNREETYLTQFGIFKTHLKFFDGSVHAFVVL